MREFCQRHDSFFVSLYWIHAWFILVFKLFVIILIVIIFFYMVGVECRVDCGHNCIRRFQTKLDLMVARDTVNDKVAQRQREGSMGESETLLGAPEDVKRSALLEVLHCCCCCLSYVSRSEMEMEI